jgi:putative acetyltransferase
MSIERFSVRPARADDAEALCEIQTSAIRKLGLSHYSQSDVDAWAEGLAPDPYVDLIAKTCVLVAERDGVPIGFSSLDLQTGEFVSLYVAPAEARRGVGHRLVAELMEQGRAAGLARIFCESSLGAVGLYERAGFTAGRPSIHRLPDRAQIQCVPMEWRAK